MAKNHQTPSEYDANKTYSIEEALKLLPQLSTSKFVGSVDVDIIVKPGKKKKQETVRGSVSFSHGFGEQKRIIAFTDEQGSKDAILAGAVDAGLDELIKKVEEGKVEYDVVLSTPEVMAKIAKLGRILGPKGLMPSPANGTITTNIASTVKAYLAGKQDFKLSDQQAVRGRVAKLDMSPEQIEANLVDFLRAVFNESKKVEQQPFKQITLSPTMGKGVKLNIDQVIEKINS